MTAGAFVNLDPRTRMQRKRDLSKVEEHSDHRRVRSFDKKVSRKVRHLLTYDELEPWRRDNEWILTGYRVSEGTYAACVESLFYIHNETGNIMSHLIGAGIFVALSFYVYGWLLAEALLWDKIIFMFFLLSAIGCMGISGLFHLFSSHSEATCAVWNRGDYLGIVMLIVGSASPSIYYSFHCEPYLQFAYMALMLVLGAAVVPFILLPRFNTPQYRTFRATLFVLLGSSGIIPTIHSVLSLGFVEATKAGALEHMATMGLFYLVGAWLYAARLPERHFPGAFDIWFHSHQIFHYCVFAAAAVHFIGLITAFQWHRENSCEMRSEATAALLRNIQILAHDAKDLLHEAKDTFRDMTHGA